MRNRHIIATAIAIAALMATYCLGQRLFAHLQYLKASNLLREEHYSSAVAHLQKAIQYSKNDSLIWRNLGHAYRGLGKSCPLEKAFPLAIKAKEAYLKAARLNPLDSEAAYALAKQEALLERIYPFLHPRKETNPHDAFPYFQATLRLRPNGILYNYAYIRYLHRQKKKTDELLRVVTHLARIYPGICYRIRSEKFWSAQVKEAIKRGLQQAIDEGIAPQSAGAAMFAFLKNEKDWPAAISHYKELLALQATDRTPEQYLSLGHLYMENGQFEAAEESFVKAIFLARSKEKILERICGIYRAKGSYDALHRLFLRLGEVVPPSARIDILFVRFLVNRKRYNEARKILNRLNQEQPRAETYYWLYRIARSENSLDNMELFIRKASLLDRENSEYHLILSQVLQQVKKLDSAEKEAGLAIKYAANPSFSLYDHRARIRWRKKDFPGALEDWKSAISLKPDNAYFHARAAEAYLQLGQLPQALHFYQKATHLNPKNQNYRNKYKALRSAAR